MGNNDYFGPGIEATALATKLVRIMDERVALGFDLSQSIVSVSSGKFMILCVPRGREGGAAAVLNR